MNMMLGIVMYIVVFAFFIIPRVKSQALLMRNGCKNERFADKIRRLELQYAQCMHKLKILDENVSYVTKEVESMKTQRGEFVILVPKIKYILVIRNCC